MGCILEGWSGAQSLADTAARYVLVVVAGGLAPDDMSRLCDEAHTATPRPAVVAIVEPEDAGRVLAASPDELVFRHDPREAIEWRLRRLLGESALSLVPERQSLLVHGEEVHLTEHELGILELLFRHRGVVVRREDLLAHAWNGEQVSPGTLDTYINHIREKMGVESGRLQTVRGVGYRLSCPW